MVADARRHASRSSTPPPAGCSASGDGGRQAPRRRACSLQDRDGNELVRLHRPYDGLATRTALTEQAWSSPTAPRCWSPPGIARGRRRAPGAAGSRSSLRSARARGPARPRALRPGRHRRPRAALAADRRQGLRRRRCSTAWDRLNDEQKKLMLDDGQRRRRPAHPADRRAARRGPASTPAGSRCYPRPLDVAAARRAGWSTRSAPAPAARSPSTSPATCPRSRPTPTSSPRWSPTWSRTRSGTATGTVTLDRAAIDDEAPYAGVLLHVDDEGDGIARDIRSRVFTKFWKHGSRGGSGLGHVHRQRAGPAPTAARSRSTTRPAAAPGSAIALARARHRRRLSRPTAKPGSRRARPRFLDWRCARPTHRADHRERQPCRARTPSTTRSRSPRSRRSEVDGDARRGAGGDRGGRRPRRAQAGPRSSTPATGRRWRWPTARSARCRRRPARRPGQRVGQARGAVNQALAERQAVLEAEHEERMLVEETVDVTLPCGPRARRAPGTR